MDLSGNQTGWITQLDTSMASSGIVQLATLPVWVTIINKKRYEPLLTMVYY